MRDTLLYTQAQIYGETGKLCCGMIRIRRKELLYRFIDRESTVFLGRFWVPVPTKERAGADGRYMVSDHATPNRLAVIYRTLYPKGSMEQLGKFWTSTLPEESEQPEPKRLKKNVWRGDPDRLSCRIWAILRESILWSYGCWPT